MVKILNQQPKGLFPSYTLHNSLKEHNQRLLQAHKSQQKSVISPMKDRVSFSKVSLGVKDYIKGKQGNLQEASNKR